MNCDEIVSGLILEFRRGTLIMVVLAQLNKPMYGYSLIKELEGKGISIEGNTLYPLQMCIRDSICDAYSAPQLCNVYSIF